MAVGFPTKVSYANGDVFSASDINDTNGTINLLTSSTLSMAAAKNCVINGGYDIWQRGTSIALTASSSNYVTDRFYAYRGGLVTGGTVSRQATGDTTNLASIQYCARVQRDNGNTSTQPTAFVSDFESANSIPYAGKTVTLSFYARKGALYSAASNALSVTLYSGTGTDQRIASGYTGSATPISQTATLTTTWQRFSYTATVASTATQLGLYFLSTPVGTAGATDYYEITGVQLELGSTATTFSRAGGTIQGELAACQRYYERFTSDTIYGVIGVGSGANAGVLQLQIPYKVTKRVSASTIDTSAMNTFYWQSGAASGNTPTTVTINVSSNSPQFGWVEINKAASFTAAAFYQVLGNNTGSAFIGFSAEL
jgi:hypothetical protein